MMTDKKRYFNVDFVSTDGSRAIGQIGAGGCPQCAVAALASVALGLASAIEEDALQATVSNTKEAVPAPKVLVACSLLLEAFRRMGGGHLTPSQFEPLPPDTTGHPLFEPRVIVGARVEVDLNALRETEVEATMPVTTEVH